MLARIEDQKLPLSEFDLILLSEVTHLIEGWDRVARRLAAALTPGGLILIRTSSHQQLRERDWYQLFPRALEVDLARHIGIKELTDVLRLLSLSIEVRTVCESREVGTDWYLELLANRAFSTLHYLTDEELAEGVAQARAALEDKRLVYFDYEMTCVTAMKR